MPRCRSDGVGGRCESVVAGSQNGATAMTRSSSSCAASRVAISPPRLTPTTLTYGLTSARAQAITAAASSTDLADHRADVRRIEAEVPVAAPLIGAGSAAGGTADRAAPCVLHAGASAGRASGRRWSAGPRSRGGSARRERAQALGARAPWRRGAGCPSGSRPLAVALELELTPSRAAERFPFAVDSDRARIMDSALLPELCRVAGARSISPDG